MSKANNTSNVRKLVTSAMLIAIGTAISLVALAALTVLMLFDETARQQVVTVVIAFGLLSAVGFWVTRDHDRFADDSLTDRSGETTQQ